ncbi:MAG TPA: 3-oxoacyl-[acyl-carrier-protein] synthase III C-terminal domain-containing protein [Coleofasciculaceae cyanobacterium]|jgi:3-oxoacyl-[acyl-carrier-protein] synthase III/acyl carrier protein
MTGSAVGICSLAVSFPSVIRTNEYWYETFPELANAQAKRVRSSKTRSSYSNPELDIWSQEVAPYLNDPFRGNVERRILAEAESPLMLECCAAQDALAAANLCPDDIELAIASTLFSELVGNAPSIARQLRLRCPAWNLESTCSSALVALQTAHRLVQAGEYRNALVVVSQFGSRAVDEADTLSWSMGDGVGALVVSSLQPHQGVLSTSLISTRETCGAYAHELVADAQGVPRIRTRTGENASAIAETAVAFVRTCCEEAVTKAGVQLDQIDFFAFNTPTAWYASVCARALGIDPARTINLYPRYANVGAVLPIANLYHAAASGKLRENDLVLVYTNGAGATAGATVMRWGKVGLGTVPAPPIGVTAEQEKVLCAGGDAEEESFDSGILSREELLKAEPTQRQQRLEAYLLNWLANSLQLPQTQLTSQQSFATLLDSLLALTLKSRIEKDLQVQVPMEQFFGETTIAQFAERVLNQLILASLTASNSSPTADTPAKYRETLSL